MRNIARWMTLSLVVGTFAAKLATAAPNEVSRLTLHVLTEADKKPVASAHVIVRFVSGKKLFIKDKRTSWEAQTNKKGDLVLDELPLGNVKIQVIAKGYQTFGDNFELTKTEEDLIILVKPPAKQLSAY